MENIDPDTLLKKMDKFMEILEKYGLYYELGNAWNLTCCLIDDAEVEYTYYERPKEMIRLYRGDFSTPSGYMVRLV